MLKLHGALQVLHLHLRLLSPCSIRNPLLMVLQFTIYSDDLQIVEGPWSHRDTGSELEFQTLPSSALGVEMETD